MGICVNTCNICHNQNKSISFENQKKNSFLESTNDQHNKGSEMDENNRKLSLSSKKPITYLIGGSEMTSKKVQKRSPSFNKRRNLNLMKPFYRSKTKNDFSERENDCYSKQNTKSFDNNPSSNDVLNNKDGKGKRRLSISERGVSSISQAILSDQEINIIIIGETKVGKTTFVLKVIGNPFEKIYIPSISIEIKIKKKKFNNINYTLKFTVIPGDEKYKKDYSTLYNNAKFILVFYDISKEHSFLSAKETLMKEKNKYKQLFESKNIDILFIGNKIDLGKKSSQLNEVQSFCEEQNYELFEISVKTGVGFKGLINKILNKTFQNQIIYDENNEIK